MLALPFFLIAVVFEWVVAWRNALSIYERQDFQTSMSVMLITILIDLLPKFCGITLMFVCYDLSPLKDWITNTPTWWLVLFFLDDFTYYVFHRANHEVRLMWAGHVPHHNSQYYNYGTALRQGVAERCIKYFFWCPLAFLGFHPTMILTAISLSLIYQFWLHTETIDKMAPWFEFLFNTPSHHRVHHGSNIRYLDRNHGGVLIIWDRIFSTFSEELKTEPVRYGLTKNIQTFRPAEVAFGEFSNMNRDVKRANRWRDKISYLCRAPGWSHDGEDCRSDTLRKKHEATAH